METIPISKAMKSAQEFARYTSLVRGYTGCPTPNDALISTLAEVIECNTRSSETEEMLVLVTDVLRRYVAEGIPEVDDAISDANQLIAELQGSASGR